MRIARFVIVLVVGSLILVSGAANAGPRPGAADELSRLHGQVSAARDAGDLTAMKNAVADLAPTLHALSSPDPASRVHEEVRAKAAEAHRSNDALAAGLSRSTGVDQRAIPPLPGPLGTLSDLVNTLLAALTALIASLVGGGLPPLPPLPAPLPTLPPPPTLPTPPLPAPLPTLPTLPTPPLPTPPLPVPPPVS